MLIVTCDNYKLKRDWATSRNRQREKEKEGGREGRIKWMSVEPIDTVKDVKIVYWIKNDGENWIKFLAEEILQEILVNKFWQKSLFTWSFDAIRFARLFWKSFKIKVPTGSSQMRKQKKKRGKTNSTKWTKENSWKVLNLNVNWHYKQK